MGGRRARSWAPLIWRKRRILPIRPRESSRKGEQPCDFPAGHGKNGVVNIAQVACGPRVSHEARARAKRGGRGPEEKSMHCLGKLLSTALAVAALALAPPA